MQCHNTEVSFYELVHSSGMHIKVPETYVLQKFTEHCNQGFIVMADQGTDATVLSLFNNVTPEEIMQVIIKSVSIFCVAEFVIKL